MIPVMLFNPAYQISLADPREILDIGAGVFALVLFSISLYAWFIRRLISLIIVALAFLMFFARALVQEFQSSLPGWDVLDDSLVFVALALFFLAIVVRPKRDVGKGTS